MPGASVPRHRVAAGRADSLSGAGAVADQIVDWAAMRRDPHYRQFVQALVTIVYDQMEQEGKLSAHWRRPGSRRRDKGENGEEAAVEG